MTREIGKVIQKTRFKSAEAAVDFDVVQSHRALVLGGSSDSHSPKGLIGKVVESSSTRSMLDYSIWLDLGFPHVIGVFGTRGSGKSFDLGILAECALVAGDSVSSGDDFDGGVIVFDIQDQFWTLGFEPDPDLEEDRQQLNDLKQWKISPASAPTVALWLPSGCTFPSSNTKDFTISPAQLQSEDWLALLELDRYSPQGQALLSLLEFFPNSTPSDLASKCQPALLSNFQTTTVEALRWRLEAIEGANIISTNGTNIEELIGGGSASVLLLRELSDELRALVVGVITRMVADKMGRMHKSKRIARRTGDAIKQTSLPNRVWLIVDEAHTVAPSEGTTAATQPIIDYVKRGRDAGLSLIFATQQPSAVDKRLMSQVDLTITHRLGFESDLSAALARMPTMSSGTYEIGGGRAVSNMDLIRSLKTGEAIAADSNSPRTLVIKLRPRVSAHGGNTPK